ncbi:MAG: hypothetical protein HWQ41_09310 [Nostoc sp. NOS(2021)]|uniref:hypothetical protein n=1 Tax=Nostoc sp. NOS(2021) TaxID=2815407 RepID=UPI0025CDC846|nr:hypothetical protein [Nostoc sp. NOS(2021)]MBN3895446.1 hypothetical protein [Nostoc sp. NOS(2021)]
MPEVGGRLSSPATLGLEFPADFHRTYAKLHAVGAIHELPLPKNQGFGKQWNVLLRSYLLPWRIRFGKASAILN